MTKNPHHPFRRPLTDKDCRRGFCNFERIEKGYVSNIEVCKTCGRKVSYPLNGGDNKKWMEDHKLDLLQPMGKTLKDFIEYYGEVQTTDTESS